ncbi:MAG: DnaJ domain-containing protein [Nitrospirae bacterium]|nr:DnaJ domain-containing protein [Nitrospirota bacterium]
MTRDTALNILKLSSAAGKEEIESTYYKLVKRYPPEFNPDKFREIDEAYRYLTSFTVMIESLLSGDSNEGTVDAELFSFTLPSESVSVDDAMREIKNSFKIAHLWSGLTSDK